jgi:hypothetical protein
LFREDTLRITGAAPTTIGAGAFAAATLADNFSTNAFTSLKFDLAANASLLFSAADGKLFVLADLAANASLTAIAFLTANICVAFSNAFLNAGSDVAASEDGTTVIGADAPFAAAFGDGDGDADAAFGDATTTIGAAAAAATAPSPTDAPFADAFGESKFIIGDDCAGATTATGAAAATAPLDLNPGGPGKNTGSLAGPPSAPRDLILTIILGFDFGFLLLLLDDHELFDDFRDAAFGDAAFGDASAPFADTAFGDATFGDADAAESAEPIDDQCATHDFGDVPFGDAFGDAADDAIESSEPTDDAAAAESAEPVDDQCTDHDFGDTAAAAFGDAAAAARGESKIIIGDDDADFAFGDGATGTAPLDLNPGGPGKNTGSGAGTPFAPVDLILTIILGFDFGFLLLLLDDHELFDDFRDVPFDDDDDDDIVLDDVPLLEEFFEPDAAFDDTDGESKIIIGDDDADFAFDAVDAVPDDKLLSEDFLELDDAYDPFAIKPRFTPL